MMPKKRGMTPEEKKEQKREQDRLRKKRQRERKKQNVTDVTQNVTDVTQNVTDVTQNVTPVTPDVPLVTENVPPKRSNLVIVPQFKKIPKKEIKMESVRKLEKKLNSWASLESSFTKPECVVLGSLILIFSSYLVWQGTLFFQKLGLSFDNSLVSAFVGEMLCIASACLFSTSVSKFSKILSGVLCLLSVVSLSIFLHSGVSKNLVSSSPEYQRLQGSYLNLKNDVTSLKITRDNLGSSYITKKTRLQSNINLKQKEIKDISNKMTKLEKAGVGAGEFYLVWLRVALVVLNLVLVDRIFKSLG